jgi:hypothetical protein
LTNTTEDKDIHMHREDNLREKGERGREGSVWTLGCLAVLGLAFPVLGARFTSLCTYGKEKGQIKEASF